MVVDVVIGLQGGDEGKGKVAEYLGINGDYSIAMRSPAPQAGHSIVINGKRIGLANLPCPVKNPNLRLLIGRGGLISLERLLYGEISAQGKKSEAEIPATGITPDRLGIDYETRVVTKEHRKREQENKHLMGKIGSIGSGTSGCRIDTILRVPLPKAKDFEELKQYLTDTRKEIYEALEKGENILVEGDHGAKLDPIHSGEYPYVTTRIVSAAGFIAESGIPPMEVGEVYGVIKPYTTRVADGPLEGEIFDEEVLKWTLGSGGESGSVSGRKRRVGKFEWENVSDVIKMNGITRLAITHMDSPQIVWNALGYKNGEEFLNNLDKRFCRSWPLPRIALLSYGPKLEDIKKI